MFPLLPIVPRAAATESATPPNPPAILAASSTAATLAFPVALLYKSCWGVCFGLFPLEAALYSLFAVKRA